MNKRHILTSSLPANAKRRALLGLGMASVLAAAGCGGGGGAQSELLPPNLPPEEGPPDIPGEPLVDARAWQPAREIAQELAVGVSVEEPVVAVDGAGGGMAVWLRTESSRTVLMASRYSPEGEWLPPVQINGAVNGVPSSPRIAMDALGNAIAVWEQAFAGRTNVVYNRYSSESEEWALAEALQREFDTPATQPRIAMDGLGNAVAVWCQSRDPAARKEILSSTYAAGVGWSPVLLSVPEAAGVEPSFNPQLELDAAGHAYVVWQRLAAGGQGNEIWSSFLPAAVEGSGSVQAWSAAMDVARSSSSVVSSNERPSLAVGEGGVAMVVWQRATASSSSIRARRYLPGASQWEAFQAVAAKVGDQNDPMPENPRVRIDSTGCAIAVWDQVSPTNGRTISASRFTPEPEPSSGSWSEPVILERVRGGLSLEPKLALDASGNALVVWGQEDEAGEPTRVLAARYFAVNDQWSSSGQLLQTAGAPAGSGVQVAVRGDGTALGIWKQVSPTSGQVASSAIWSADFK